MWEAGTALSRFGLGGKRGEPVPRDPRAWLLEQVAPGFRGTVPVNIEASPSAYATFASGRTQRADLTRKVNQARKGKAEFSAEQQESMQSEANEVLLALRGAAHRNLNRDIGARLQTAVGTETPFFERLVYFWSNHFAISAEKGYDIRMLAGPYEAEAIRPHVTGNFADMLLAVARHPAMLAFLDQSRSVGPNSRFIKENPKHKLGLNENLGRELLELHTLGVRSGYTQADVVEMAKALTGWSIAGDPALRLPAKFVPHAPAGTFIFIDAIHEPGPRTLMGKSYPQKGADQARAMIADLVLHPATARHLATKLAMHFAGDSPPKSLIDKLAQSYLDSSADLTAVYRTLVEAPESWAPQAARYKNPWDWMVSALRASGGITLKPAQAASLLGQLGQPVWQPGSPAGYDDNTASWLSPESLMLRVDVAERIVGADNSVGDVRALAQQLFPGALSPPTQSAIARAESPAQALAILICSPEMLRR